MTRDPWSVRLCGRWHALLARLLPRAFRTRFGDEMRQTFLSACRDAQRRGGMRALAVEMGRDAGAVFATACRLHCRGSRRTLAVLMIALALGGLSGWVDQNATEVQAPALLVLVSALVCSLLQPRGAWLWWLTATASIPVASLVARWCGHAQPFESQPFSWLIAAIPAGIGAGLGVGAATLRRHRQPMPPAAV